VSGPYRQQGGAPDGRSVSGLSRVGFDPASDLALADSGAWIWKSDNRALHDYVRGYFAARDEDDVSEATIARSAQG
jgi:hypothetical protein